MNTNRPEVDLNELKKVVLAQQSGNPIPPESQIPIGVGRYGNLERGNGKDPSEPFSVFPTDTFHARREDELAIVRKYMPPGTLSVITDDGTHGWIYEFNCEFGNHFKMFAYFDGQAYQTMVISPTIEEKYSSPHTGHIFSDGRICMGSKYNGGMPTLQQSYAKSVLWANGISAMIFGNTKFPFSINNQ